LALISDIHGNLDALDAVLADVEAVGCEDVRCLGDLVGYGPDPEGCVVRIREVASVALRGNHDAAVVAATDQSTFNEVAHRAIHWTRDQLSEKSTRFLEALPFMQEDGSVLLSHAHPLTPQDWSYVFVGDPLQEIFTATEAEVMAIGHTHFPAVGNDRDRVMVPLGEGSVRLEEGVRYLFNVGSVGQPRDHDIRAAWGLLDLLARTFEIRRVEYDVVRVQQKILDSGLPPFLALRLSQGF
jgi:diadenosine tetraphosphatase ApaH/serine/threonine PP2A family protein phosphatase